MLRYRFETFYFFLTFTGWFKINLVIFVLDPDWPNFVDPDPHTIIADPQHWINVQLFQVVLGSTEACKDTTATILGYNRPLDWKV